MKSINADLEPTVDSLDELMEPVRKPLRMRVVEKPVTLSPAELVALAVSQMGEVIARSNGELALTLASVVGSQPKAEPAQPEKPLGPCNMTFARNEAGQIEMATVLATEPGSRAWVFLFNRNLEGVVTDAVASSRKGSKSWNFTFNRGAGNRAESITATPMP